eukprot:TRINITY_DN521_c0_g3_i2.p1 TRINITY_DN521_c0_g3~~TRINITY_DN521_c0_g3_i2.p1  ORF type:complete len:105 (-),score=17.21 TRINITY_DN521_c0_g3_i2:295-609(-)
MDSEKILRALNQDRLIEDIEAKHMHSAPFQKNTIVFIDFTVGKQLPVRIFFELRNDIAPLSCERFARLCAGDGDDWTCYKGTHVSRIDKGRVMQCGDLSTAAVD